MTDEAHIASRVRELLGQVLDLPAQEIGPDLTADTAASWTSLNHLMLVSQLESEFGVYFTNQEIRELTSYRKIVDTVSRRSSAVG